MSKDNRRLRTFVKRFINPVLRNLAHSSIGPFALLRHVGRRSGKAYENPIWVWRVPDGFVIVLTYGSGTDWLRNLQAAGQGTLRWHKQEYVFEKPLPVGPEIAMPALPPFIRFVLQRRGVHEFVKLPGHPVS